MPTCPRALGAGLAIGLAELTKFTWITLFAWWPLLLMVRFIRESFSARRGDRISTVPPSGELSVPSPNLRITRRERLVQLAVLLYLCVCLINVGYLCEGSLTPPKGYEFASAALAGRLETRGGLMGNRVRGT